MPEYPVSRDRRYTVRLEFCGYPQARFVARFCGEWIGQSPSKPVAAQMAAAHNQRRMGAAILEALTA